MRENVAVWRDVLPADVPVVSLAKGVEIGTGLRMSQVISQVGHIEPGRVVVLSGPNLALEIAEGQATATVMACTVHDTAVAVQLASASSYFRPYTITDVIGTDRVRGVGLADGRQIEADLLVVAAGVRPSTDIAVRSGLEVERGIVVDDQLRTDDPDIYAIGACIYACMQGYPPNDAPQRIEKDRLALSLSRLRNVYSDNLIEVTEWCMSLDPLSRPQSVFALQKELARETERRYTKLSVGEKMRLQFDNMVSDTKKNVRRATGFGGVKSK